MQIINLYKKKKKIEESLSMHVSVCSKTSTFLLLSLSLSLSLSLFTVYPWVNSLSKSKVEQICGNGFVGWNLLGQRRSRN